MMTGLNNNFGRRFKKKTFPGYCKSVLFIIDIWPWNMDSPLSDDPNGEHYDLNAFINNQVKNRMKKLLLLIESNFRILGSIDACWRFNWFWQFNARWITCGIRTTRSAKSRNTTKISKIISFEKNSFFSFFFRHLFPHHSFKILIHHLLHLLISFLLHQQ